MNRFLTTGIPVLIIAAGAIGLQIFGQKPEIPIQDAEDTDAAVPVETATVSAYNQPFDITVEGDAVTWRVVTVGSEVEGRIVRKSESSRSGTFIQKGEPLFEIDAANYELQVDQLNAQLLQADEELNSVGVDLENAESLILLAEEDWQLQQNQLRRMKELLARQTANETEVEAAMKLELTARHTLQTLKNEIRTLTQQRKTKQANRTLVESQLQRARLDVVRCRVLSPLEGRVVDDLVEEGDYIKVGDDLVHISDASRMEIKTQLKADELAWIWQQQSSPAAPTKATPGTDPVNLPQVACEVAYVFEGVETIWDGYVSRIEGTGIDRDLRMFPCRVLVPDPHKTRVKDTAGGRFSVSPPALMSGMYVTVRIPVESPVPLLQLPLEAVRPGGMVWVAREGELDILNVSLAHTQNDVSLIRSDSTGLAEGDKVIVSPLASVRQGMAVREDSQTTNAATATEKATTTPATDAAADVSVAAEVLEAGATE